MWGRVLVLKDNGDSCPAPTTAATPNLELQSAAVLLELADLAVELLNLAGKGRGEEDEWMGLLRKLTGGGDVG